MNGSNLDISKILLATREIASINKCLHVFFSNSRTEISTDQTSTDHRTLQKLIILSNISRNWKLLEQRSRPKHAQAFLV